MTRVTPSTCLQPAVRTVRSEPKREQSGFTLIEVLIAMLVLAFGLLGLEALGIAAARSISLAERQSGFAMVAADSLESAMHQLRQQVIPNQFCQTNLDYGDRLSRSINIGNPQLARVTVRVLPGSTTTMAPADTFEIASSLYLPVALAGPVPGSPCS